MDNGEPGKDLLSMLDVKGVKIGDTIVFCPSCLWQVVNAAVVNECPQCYMKHQLRISKVDQELLELCGKKAAEVTEAQHFLNRNIFDLDLILELAELRALIKQQKGPVIVTNEMAIQRLRRIAELMQHLTLEQREMVANGTVITEQLRDLLYTEALQGVNHVTH